ncbi:16S rRNA (cytosine(967)-C(5))-methyltransferase RsmB [Ohessyouella blattaphilus]|uniref:16S rRNA (cytosine(967)-C(5))-methyltransferase n=1 Tax=Ohessyouella blattaphilus TaxID=2949333 RepID=A0ABT1EDU0_9FIRM|nr:16S rRNA (cytosine(967)-C(5))-methyltransferase RsmB [Ohessyouella blattaphilus]MCP1108808.1 16S rRNA (cytosine(967)-C(5))-methyltransferase RsmB [Ohessyouella blattaphilus]MCR8562202.1 16S rRNA (cytosine(967)-C(5))-methyltransferase RsmB [Ohessyouella blattaphilus]
MTNNDREIILETLLMVTKEGAFSHQALKNVLDKYQYLEKKERAFITKVVSGTLEFMLQLDYIIDSYSKVKVKKMKPVIREILRSSVFQIMYLDRVPDAAICNEAVKLAKKKGFKSLSGFVNGVLRTISREKEKISFPDLATRYALPQWLVTYWQQDYDSEVIATMGAAFLSRAPLTVRVNEGKIAVDALLTKLAKEGITARKVPDFPAAIELTEIDYLEKSESFRAGEFYVQDLSSMRVGVVAAPKEGDYVIDVCGAPGGKALHVSELLKGSGQVSVRDLTEYKVGLIKENIAKSGLTNIQARVQDALVLDEQAVAQADIVIADLPCSGLGVLGRKPDLKRRITEADLSELATLQQEILAVVKAYVKPGGKLLYSTCTINKRENEDNTGKFLAANPDFSLVSEKQYLPGIDPGDGFYIALMQRKTHG